MEDEEQRVTATSAADRLAQLWDTAEEKDGKQGNGGNGGKEGMESKSMREMARENAKHSAR
jgi:hypothetical protein